MTTITKMKSLSKGTERAFEHMDVQHPVFPVPVYLMREALMNSVRHNASEFSVTYTEQENGDFSVVIFDNGDGIASFERIVTPAEENGEGTSRYGNGMRMLRLRNDGPDGEWSAAWKKEGDMFYHSLEFNPKTREHILKAINIGGTHRWQSPDDQGFILQMTLRKDKLEDFDAKDIAPMIHELCCVSMTPATLAGIHVRIDVLDVKGIPLMEKLPQYKLKKDGTERKCKHKREPRVFGVADSEMENWRSILTVLREDAHEHFPSWSHTLSSGAIAKGEYFRIKPADKKKPLDPGMPNYTAANSQAALIVQDGFITDVPLYEALDRAQHGASMNGRFMVLDADRAVDTIILENEDRMDKEEAAKKKERIRQESIPLLAASKVTFLGEMYYELLGLARANKPKLPFQWDKHVKEAVEEAVSSDDSASISSAAAPHPMAERPVKRNVEAASVVVPTAPPPVPDLDALKTMIQGLSDEDRKTLIVWALNGTYELISLEDKPAFAEWQLSRQ